MPTDIKTFVRFADGVPVMADYAGSATGTKHAYACKWDAEYCTVDYRYWASSWNDTSWSHPVLGNSRYLVIGNPTQSDLDNDLGTNEPSLNAILLIAEGTASYSAITHSSRAPRVTEIDIPAAYFDPFLNEFRP